MEKVDFVLVGAEGVVESGGIINKVSKSVHNIIAFFANNVITKILQQLLSPHADWLIAIVCNVRHHFYSYMYVFHTIVKNKSKAAFYGLYFCIP